MPDKVERAVFKIVIRGTMEAVWREITKTDSAQQCFFNMCLHTPGLKVGAPMQMRTRSGKYVGAVGKVLEFSPPHRYAHTFRFTNLDDPECKVIYDLKEVPGGVEFMMTLEDLPAGTKTAKQMTQGGTMIINTLKAIVETGRPSLGIRMLYAMFGVLEPVTTPKRCRVDHWPLASSESA
jgi:uncharacterized protein YndB with AHSA1/START domain